MRWHFCDKILLFQYRQYSCGKFLSNILSYNKNFIPQYGLKDKDDVTISELLDIYNKHKVIMSTLPPIEKMFDWMKYELGCEKFYGLDIIRGRKTLNLPKIKLEAHLNKKAEQLLHDNKHYVFAMSHSDPHYAAWKGIFPLSIDVQLINDNEVNKISRLIKDKGTGLINTRFTYRDSSYKFDIGTMFDKTLFFKEVTKMLTHLKLDDISLDDKVYEYYDSYISIYEPYIEVKK